MQYFFEKQEVHRATNGNPTRIQYNKGSIFLSRIDNTLSNRTSSSSFNAYILNTNISVHLSTAYIALYVDIQFFSNSHCPPTCIIIKASY